MKRVLVLCTGNSCRSIIAEVLISALADGEYQAFSAGSCPVGYVHPESIRTLNRHGFNTEKARSKSWDEFAGEQFDLVITVCDQAARETCPVFLGESQKLHWSTPDPAKVEGSEEMVRTAFDDVLHLLRNRIEKELL